MASDLTESESTELYRRIIADPDSYAETVNFCQDFLEHEYARLTKRFPHKVAAWRMEALKEQLERQYKIKLFYGFK